MSYKNQMFDRTTEDDPEEQKIIDTIRNSNDLSEIEEYFVKDISNLMIKRKITKIEDLDKIKFIEIFKKSLEALELNNYELNDSNTFELLNSPMSAIFPEENSDLFQSNLVLFESNFRE
jgi:hypothetical protein